MRTVLLVLLIAIAGCQPAPQAPEPPPTQQVTIVEIPDVPDPVPTSLLEPQAFRITLDDLPPPFATESARQGPRVVEVPDAPVLYVPEGFRVNVFAADLDRPRWLALSPEGDVLVTETRENRIRRLRDTDGDGAADQRWTFADGSNGLDIPFGMAFATTNDGRDTHFFLGNTDEVRRYAYTYSYPDGDPSLQGQGERITELPGGGYNQHWTRNVIPDASGDSLYVSVGSESNVDEEPLPRAAVLKMALDGSGRRVYGSGLRNPVGLAVQPGTGELFTTVNERDRLGDGLVPDYFTRVQPGGFYGWPYAYLAPDNLDPRRMDGDASERPDLAAATLTPDVLFESHSAALGVQFYDPPQDAPSAFPQRYRGGAFVVFRGSWNRSQGTGYKLVFVPFDGTVPEGGYEDFLTGFLLDPAGPTTWGRPVGLLVLNDGSLLFTEEANGRIYRVSFEG